MDHDRHNIPPEYYAACIMLQLPAEYYLKWSKEVSERREKELRWEMANMDSCLAEYKKKIESK